MLYVEDEDTNWEVAELSLRGRYDLVRARNARECFEMLKKHKYELVLMDIQLSGSELDGVQITNILKGLYQEEAPEFTSGSPPGCTHRFHDCLRGPLFEGGVIGSRW